MKETLDPSHIFLSSHRSIGTVSVRNTDRIQYNTIQYNTIQYNIVQYNTFHFIRKNTPNYERTMMASSHTNKRTQVRFGGAEDASIRSAWKSNSKSYSPSPVQRQATIGSEAFEKARSDAAMVAALDAGSNNKSSNAKHVKGVLKPPSPKNRSKTVPILKAILKAAKPKMASRSAWESTETPRNLRSMMGPSPAQRQKTLESDELRVHCASIAAMDRDWSSSLFVRDIPTRDSSARGYRGPFTRSSSIKETPMDTQEEQDRDSSC